MDVSARRRRPLSTPSRRLVSAVVAATVLAACVQARAVAAAPARFAPLRVQSEHVVAGAPGRVLPYAPDPAAAHALTKPPPAPAWPTGGSATVDLTAAASQGAGPGSGGGAAPPATRAAGAGAGAAAPAGSGAQAALAGMVRAGSLPVLLGAGRVGAAAGVRTAAAPMHLQVRVLERPGAAKGGAAPLVLRLARADGTVTPGPVHVGVDTAGFRSAYGGDWAQRLYLEALPECALATPEAAGCQGTPLPSRNHGGTVVADLEVAAGPGTLVALTAGASGASGSFAATSLAAEGTWEAGGSSGDFSWSYPMRVPPALGGPEPTLSLAYSAQSVDGRQAASNNQPSWIGEGFEFWSGYVERRYKGCADDMGSGANNTTKTGDQCWGTDNATMSLGGKVSELVKDDATGAWHPRVDDGSRIEHLTGASNGDNNGEYWKVTTPDGTQYWFGRARLPGWVAGKPITNSTWTVPVFGNNPGEPCHQSTFDASWCTQAWRWNLDYVVDPHGNSMSYWYAGETNKYGRDLDPAKVSTYTRGGYLTGIDYGTRTEAEFGTAPMRVRFAVADRCLPNTTCDSVHPANWPDVPWDQSCTGSTCQQSSPTFWTTKRLATITTQVWSGTAYRDVESWTLKHAYPDPGDGTRAGLWLAGIGHTGLVGGSASLPDVTFTGVQLSNRVDTVDHSPAMNWWRVASIRNGAGGEISVGYSPPDCVAGSRMPASPESNTLRCYPVMWTPEGFSDPIRDWFHKYVVTSVSETDHTGGSPRVLTAYSYLGTPAWHYTDDDGLIPPSQKTWSQWRGYERVGTTTGDPGQQSYGEIHYFRGMDGDHLPSGTRRATITDSRGGTQTDSDALAGQARERITYAGPGGAEVSSILTDPWQSAPTATRTINGVTTQARYVNTTVQDQRIALDGSRGFRETRTVTTFDAYGAATQTSDYGDLADPGDDQCTKYSYARNTSAWLMSYTSRVQTYGLACDQTPTSADQIIGDARTWFDGQAWGVPPTKGDTTRLESLSGWSGGTPTYVTVARSQYDANGRITDAWDVDGNHVTTAYTPASGPVTNLTVTNPLGHITSTDQDPAWGATTGITDPNGRRTDVTYDPLGRTTAVWLPGRVKGVQSASATYAYLVRPDGANAVTTQTLGPNGVPVSSYQLDDGLLRPRQTQVPAVGPSGGRIVADTLYDSAGRAFKQNAAYVADGAPGTTLFVPAGDNQIAAQTLTLFDGAGRPTDSILRAFGVEKWRTSTAYGGDHTTVTPPAGGTATDTVTDGRGRPVALRQYRGAAPAGAYDTTRYTYNAKNLPATVTDPVGNTWRYGYDLLGRRISVSDPDKGTSTATYDAGGRLLTSTDARGRTLAYTYDALGRRTAEFDGSTDGPKLATWVYDTVAKGQLTSATRFVGADAYTVAVTGYDPMYRPTGTKVTIPPVEGALAGTYQFSSTYKPDGSPSTQTLPAAGGLGQEVLSFTYSDLGQALTLRGQNTYVTQAQYTRLGEPSVLTLSTGGPIAQIGYDYDETTRRLVHNVDLRQTAPSTLADVTIGYDPAGNVTRIADAPAGGAADTQCFAYDGQRRLTEAWTPASGDCAAAPAVDALGGPAPYWESFAYDQIGDRTHRVEHSPSGDATTTYTYPPAGDPQPHTLRSATTADPAGTRTVSYTYDPAGNTVTRPAGDGTQTLSWDAEGHVSTVSDSGGAGTSSYVYDAGGNRLIRRDSSGATLYLPGMEVRANSSGQTSATRYYDFGGTTVAQRTSAGVTWLMDDRQGTSLLAVAAAGSQAVVQRRQKPFGERRGTDPAWPNQHGFVGGIDEPDGLVHLGARDYDPDTGRFVSSDPVSDASDPQQMLGYAYAANSPVTASDPSGLMYMLDGGGGGGGGGSSPPPKPAPSPHPAPTKPAPPPQCAWWDVGCHAKQAVTSAVNWVGDHKAEVVGFAVGALVGIGCGVAIGWTGVGAVACGALAGAAGSAASYLFETQVEHKSEFSWGEFALNVGFGAVTGAAGGALSAVGGAALRAGFAGAGQGLKAAAGAAASAAREEAADIVAGRVTGGLLSNAAKSGAESAVDSSLTAAKGGCNSFVPATGVLMVDGTHERIDQVQIGDTVIATDPTTGTAQAEPVTDVIIGHGRKHLVQLTVDTDGAKGHATAKLTATDAHPFWVANLHRWVDAKDLRPGNLLRTSAGTFVQVDAIRKYTRTLTVYNLTVDSVHSYYVVAGSASVLVHNCNGATLNLKYKPGWTPQQIAEADAKVAALNKQAPLVVTKPQRGVSASRTWKNAGMPKPPGTDIDHVIDLQLGGADWVFNMNPLDSSVNRSLGRQIQLQLNNLGLTPGSVVCGVTIC